jgi:type I restriction enzyme S subunit
MENQLIPQLRFSEFEETFKAEIFDDILSVTRLAGYEYSKYWKEDDNKEIIALRGYNIGNGKLVLRDLSYISNKLSLQLKRSRLFKGDIIYPCVGSIGNAVVIEEDDKYHIQQNIAKITCNKKTSPFFVSQFLMSHLGLKEVLKFNATSSQPNVLVGSLRQFKINLPSFPEQQKIASFLTDVDELITKLTKKKTLLEQYKKGVMQKIFNQELRFKDDEGNEFPDWKDKKLGDITKYYDGTHQTPNYVSKGVPFYSVEHVTANQFVKTKFISEDVFQKENKRVKLEKGDILMTRIGNVGKAKYIDWDVNASFYVSLALIKQNSTFSSKYLAQYINAITFQRELWKRIIHVAFPIKINLGEIGKCLVKLPSIEEQIKIANFLSDIDVKIDALNTKIENSKTFKKGLMQKMFV